MTKFSWLALLLMISVLFSPSLFAQADYAHGNQALEIFDQQGIENSPTWVKIWIGFMMLMFLSSLIFVRRHQEARWVIGGFVIGIAVMMLMTRVFGVPELSGFIALMHLIFWSPALIHLLRKRPFMTKPISAFSVWAGLMTATILFSFIFDIRDAFIYLNHIL